MKKWYAVYTKPRYERKVTESLVKKKVEVYCPLNKVIRKKNGLKRSLLLPVFTSYVFVRVSEPEHSMLKQIDGVVNMVYWLGTPVTIREVEIDMIRRFLVEHHSIQLEKMPVNLTDIVKVTNEPLVTKGGDSVISNIVKVSLPSLGYIMTAKVKVVNVN